MNEIRRKVRLFIVDNFLFGEEGILTDETSFMEAGIIDSTGILELVDFLEEEFGIRIRDAELLPENLDSIDLVVGFIARKERQAEVRQKRDSTIYAAGGTA